MVSMSFAYWAHTIVCSRTVYSRSSFKRSRKGRKRAEGSFSNYTDQILPFIYHQGDLTLIFPATPNLIVSLDFHMKTDPVLSWSNNRSNIIEFHTICRICNHAPIFSKGYFETEEIFFINCNLFGA